MEVLSLFAEVSVGLAGFSGIAVVLSQSPGEWSFADSLRVRMLLGAAFGALFASLVPIALLWGNVPESIAVRSGSGVVLLVFVYWTVRGSAAIRKQPPTEMAVFNPLIARFIFVVFLTGQLSQLANLFLPFGDASRLLLSFGILLLIGWAAFGLVRLLFVRPV